MIGGPKLDKNFPLGYFKINGFEQPFWYAFIGWFVR